MFKVCIWVHTCKGNWPRPPELHVFVDQSRLNILQKFIQWPLLPNYFETWPQASEKVFFLSFRYRIKLRPLAAMFLTNQIHLS